MCIRDRSVTAAFVASDCRRLEPAEMVERVCCTALDGDWSTISHVRANRIQRVDERTAAYGEPDSRACHVEGLGERVELDGHILRCLLYTSPSPRDS